MLPLKLWCAEFVLVSAMQSLILGISMSFINALVITDKNYTSRYSSKLSVVAIADTKIKVLLDNYEVNSLCTMNIDSCTH